MGKRDIQEQSQDLHFDVNEHIDDRNERQSRRSITQRHAQAPLTQTKPSFWPLPYSKAVYRREARCTYTQEQRMKPATNAAALCMQQAFRQSDQSSKQIQVDTDSVVAAA